MINELLLALILSTSFSVRTPNDDTKPLDYEFSVKGEKSKGNFTYNLKRDCPSGDLYLDWGKLSKKYDGFQFAGSKYSAPLLGQWDVESTVWFNMSKLEFIGTTKV